MWRRHILQKSRRLDQRPGRLGAKVTQQTPQESWAPSHFTLHWIFFFLFGERGGEMFNIFLLEIGEENS